MGDELAIWFPMGADFEHNWTEVFSELPLEKVLSAPTVFHNAIIKRARQAQVPDLHSASDFLINVNRIFTGQSVAYYIDANGVVHPKPDEAHCLSYIHTIKGLGSDKCEAARQHIEKSDGCVLQDPPDSEMTIYNVFKAAENLFKQLTGDSQLTGPKLDNRFKPLLDAAMSGTSGRDN